METEVSFTHSQVPATCPYPEPDQWILCPLSHLLKIHFNIILPCKPVSSKWSLSLRFQHQHLVYTSVLPHRCHMPHPTHSRFYHPNNIGWEVQIIKLLVYSFLHSTVTSSHLGPAFSQHPVLKHFHPVFLPKVRDQVSHQYKTTGKIIVLCILVLVSLPSKLEDKRFYTNWQQAFPDFNLLLFLPE